MPRTCSRKRRVRGAYYSVYNVDTDELIVCGTVKEVCDRLDITKSNVTKAVDNNQLVRRKYMIYYDGIDNEKDKEEI